MEIHTCPDRGSREIGDVVTSLGLVTLYKTELSNKNDDLDKAIQKLNANTRLRCMSLDDIQEAFNFKEFLDLLEVTELDFVAIIPTNTETIGLNLMVPYIKKRRGKNCKKGLIPFGELKKENKYYAFLQI